MARLINNTASFLVYSNLFIAACALSLAAETFVLLDLPEQSAWYLLLLFCCTLFVYSLHYYRKTKKPVTGDRLEWCRRHPAVLPATLLISAGLIAGGVVRHFDAIFLTEGRLHYSNLAWFILVPLVALAYSHPLVPRSNKALRQIGWLKMGFLSAVWAFTTTWLPVLMLVPGEHTYGPAAMAALFLHRFFFIAPLSVLFNIRDYEEDKAAGVRTIAVAWGPGKTLQRVKWLSLLTGLLSSAGLAQVFHLYHPAHLAALLMPQLLIFLYFHRFDPGKEEAFFVWRHDGLMILKALLLIFALLSFTM